MSSKMISRLILVITVVFATTIEGEKQLHKLPIRVDLYLVYKSKFYAV